MSWTVDFYNTEVMKAIQKWPIGIKAKFTWIVDLLQEHGPNEIGMPYIKALGKGLFEIRAKGKEGIGRAIFCILKGEKMIVLNGFIKKTQETPRKEIALATKRRLEVNSDE
jgi:phage-related protein